MATKIKSLHEKALLVLHTAHRSQFRKFDRDVTRGISREHDADPDNSGRYNKMLINKEALKPINSVISQAYRHHIENTLPWDDTGYRLLPTENYFAYTEQQRKYQDDFAAAVAAFVEDYHDHIEEAKGRLGKMFRASDYKPKYQVEDSFSLQTKVRPVPNADDIRVGIDAKEALKIKRQLEEDLQAVVNEAIHDLWERMHETLTIMRDRLKDYSKDPDRRFYQSWINNVRELAKIIERLNFTNDRDLERIRAKVEKWVDDLNNDEIKEKPAKAKKVASEADAILQQMAAYTG